MSTREALEALIGGQAFDFREKIERELADRSLEAIQTKRFEVGASMFGEEEIEEVEEAKMPRQMKDSKKETLMAYPYKSGKARVQVVDKENVKDKERKGYVHAEELSPAAKQKRYSDIKKAAETSKKNQALKAAEKRAEKDAAKSIGAEAEED